MMLCYLVLLCSLACDSFENVITTVQTELYGTEGENITLSCNYTSAISLHWYRQYPGSAPEFLLLILQSTGKVTQKSKIVDLDPRFSGNVNEKKTYLEISSAKVTDSALYYCALNAGGGQKLIFGTGTKLVIQTKKEVKPSIYKVGDSCLATDFTKHYAVNDTDPFNKKNITAVRYEGQNYYSSFAFDGNNCPEEGGCEAGSSDQTGEIEKDEKINFLSLGIFWLRILFLKTVVFNVLMTVKAWMS